MPSFSGRAFAVLPAVLIAFGFAASAAIAATPAAEPPKVPEKNPEKKKDESIQPAPPRRADEGVGPYDRLILRGAILIDGTGAPPVGPVDLVIEKNRIADVEIVGSPGVAIDPEKRPKAKPGDQEMDLSGMYILPGFVDMHGHIGGTEQGTLSLRSGSSTRRAANLTVPTGSPGAPSRRWPGRRTTGSGCPSCSTSRTRAAG